MASERFIPYATILGVIVAGAIYAINENLMRNPNNSAVYLLMGTFVGAGMWADYLRTGGSGEREGEASA